MSRIFPPWKSHISTQLNANIEKLGPSAAYVSLATVRPDSTAANRMVVFRGFAGESHDEETGYESDILTITTAKHSHKMRELAANPSAEICWWMGGTQEQFRVTGKIYPVTNESMPGKELDDSITKKDIPASKKQEDVSLATRAFWKKLESGAPVWEAERLRQWYRMNDHLRATFTKECPPKLEIHDMDPNTGMPINENEKDQALLDEGYSNFALMLLQVQQVDYVDLPTGAHEIYRIKDGKWVKDKLN